MHPPDSCEISDLLSDSHYDRGIMEMDEMFAPTPTPHSNERHPMHLLNEETLTYDVPEKEEPLMGREEVFSYSPHVEGSGYQNQPSYEEAPKLSKHDMSRYAVAYK